MKRIPLHTQILVALALAVVFGWLLGDDGRLAGIPFQPALDFIGSAFLRGLRMLVIPLVLSAVLTGLLGMGSAEGFARLGGKTLAYYAGTTFLAVITGLGLANLIRPGIVGGHPAKDAIGLSADTEAVVSQVSQASSADLWGVFLRMIPQNPVGAAAEGDMLSLIVFALLFGFALTRLPVERVAFQAGLWQDVYAAMLRITDLVMRFAPLGVFALVAKTVAKTGLSALAPLAGFFFTVLLALLIHACINLPLYLWLAARIPPLAHFRALSEALVTAFSTSSSSATLPRTLHCLEEKAGVSRRVSSFVVPLGATVNMDGTALYECVAVLFIAQAYGLDLSLTAQVTVVALALLTSVGVAGIPSASLVAIVIILGAVGLPLEGLGLILAVDRILDMCRTAVNVFSDASGAVLVAKWEGETLAYDKPRS